jgi:hypothetical protein
VQPANRIPSVDANSSAIGRPARLNKKYSTIQRQRWRFDHLVAVVRSAYLDGQGALATWTLQVAWMAAEDKVQFHAVITIAQYMLENPIDGTDPAILQDLLDDRSHREITLSA